MAGIRERRSARRGARSVILGLARCLALIWLVPAVLFNVDWTGHGSWQANAAAVLMILGSALFIEGALRFRSFVLTPLCVVAALFLAVVNTKAAVRNLSLASEAASEAKQARIDGASHLASQRSHLLARREAQVQLAGETAVGALEAELMQLKSSKARSWNATDGCATEKVTTSAAFCAQVAEVTGRIEAARKRDEIDADLRALPLAHVERGAAVAVPAVADSYVANIKALANEMGFDPSERIIKAEEALSRAATFEVLAALGPTCWLAFINALFGIGAASTVRTKPPTPRRERVAASEPKPVAPKASADDIDRFIADELEEAPLTASMRSSEITPLAEAWFASRGLPMPKQELWPRLGQLFKHDKNNGRPRYLGVRAKQTTPTLRLISGSSKVGLVVGMDQTV